MQYQLAEINVARAKAAMDDPVMHGFVSRLDEVNALADSSPGVTWRLQIAEGDATRLRVFDGSLLIVNMNVWHSTKSLKDYTYRNLHVEVFKQCRAWFEPFGQPHFAMWWILAGHVPRLAKVRAALEHLQQYGASAAAFTFSQVFPSPSARVDD